MLRAYHPSLEPRSDGLLTLPESESRHLLRVRRARHGEAVEVLNGRGTVCYCRINHRPGAAEPQLLIERTESFPPPACPLHLALPLVKIQALETIVEQAVEMQVASIHLLNTQRCEVRWTPADWPKKLDRLTNLILEAAKQSGHPFFPVIHPPADILPFLRQQSDRFDYRWAACLTPEAVVWPSAPQACSREGQNAIFLLGPEGDLTSEEYQCLREMAWTPIHLGKVVLRCPTAAIAGISRMQLFLSQPIGFANPD